jgi:histone demethylase JARID1
VFSFEEFICSVATACVAYPDSVDCRSARIVHATLTDIVISQTEIMSTLIQAGVEKTQTQEMEKLSDDDRECPICRNTVFLYSIQCSCSKRFACLEHAAQLCQCPFTEKTIVCRYNDDELADFGRSLGARAAVFENWKAKAEEVLENIEAASSQIDCIIKFDIQPIEDLLSAAETDWMTDELVAHLESKVAF